MNSKLFSLLGLMLFHLAVFSQTEEDIAILNSDGLTYDSVKAVVFDKGLPLEYKYKLINSITNYQEYDKIKPIYESVLNEAKKSKNDSIQMHMYIRFFTSNFVNSDLEKSKIYLDSAFLFEKKVNNPYLLLYLYNNAGAYYFYSDTPKSQEYYYKAIEYCEKMDKIEERIIPVLYNLSLVYIQNRDLVTLQKLSDKVSVLASETDMPVASFMANSLKVEYYQQKYYYEKDYGTFHDEEVQITSILDSIDIYTNKVINTYNNTKKKDLIRFWDHVVRGAYSCLAIVESERKHPDWDKVWSYIQEAESYSYPPNSFATIHIMILKAQVYIDWENYRSAVEEGLKALEYINIEEDNARYSIYTKSQIFSVLADSHEKLGDYEMAYKYKKEQSICNHIIFDQKIHHEIMEMEAKYDTQTKEREIQILKEKNIYQEKIKYLCISLAILLIIVAIITIYLSKIKRAAVLKDKEIIQMEKDELELQVNLKEEQTRRIQLEKYEALLEIYFRDIEISGKDSELKELKLNKEILSEQLKNYNEKLKLQNQKPDQQYLIQKRKLVDFLTDEIAELVERKDCADKLLYKKRLELVTDEFISQLSNNNISTMYIKYCICFAIKMEIKEVATCFSIELSSIHMIRYRLKKKLGLNNNDDLDVFLVNMLKASVDEQALKNIL